MQIIQPGASLIPARKTFREVVGTAANPLVKPLAPRRVKIIAGTGIRGEVVHVGSVFELDTGSFDGREDYSLLLGCLKAQKVDISTPLFTAPAPVAPPPMPAPVPEKKDSVMELARALIVAVKEAVNGQTKASKA